jgi:hypothetical protein
MSIQSLGAPSLRPTSLARQTELQRPAPRPAARLDGFDAAPRSIRHAVLGGTGGPINVGPVFGDALPPANGIIRPAGPSVDAPGVVAPVQDNTLAPKIPETETPRPGAGDTGQNTAPPIQNTQPPVNEVAPVPRTDAPPVQNPAPMPGVNAGPGTPTGPGAVDSVSNLPGLDARSLEELVTALVQVIDELVAALGEGTSPPAGPASPPGRTNTTATPPALTTDASAGKGTFSIRASAEWTISV